MMAPWEDGVGEFDGIVAMIKYWKLARRRLVLLGLLPMLGGILISSLGWGWKQKAASFVENLRGAEAQVLKIDSGPDDSRIEVEYLDEAGVPYRKSFQMESRQEVELRAIGKISVVYDVRDPKVVELGHIVSANSEVHMYTVVTAAGVLVLLMGLVVAGVHAKQTAEKIALLRDGQLVRTEVRDAAFGPGGKSGRFTYAFQGPNGRWFEGKSPELPAAELAEWPVGRRVLTAYKLRDPKQTEADIFGVAGSRKDTGQTA